MEKKKNLLEKNFLIPAQKITAFYKSRDFFIYNKVQSLAYAFFFFESPWP